MAVQYAERFVMHTVESEFVNLMIKCLDEIVTVFENTLSCWTGAQMDLNHEKIEIENLITHSLW